MPPAHNPIAALSDADRRLFLLYIHHHQSLPLLAAALAALPAGQRVGLPFRDQIPDYFALLDWLESPRIQAALAAHDRAESRADRAAARAALRSTLETATTDPERRRAATPLLRLAATTTSHESPASRERPTTSRERRERSPSLQASSDEPRPFSHPTSPPAHANTSRERSERSPSLPLLQTSPAARLMSKAGAAPSSPPRREAG